MLSRDLQITLDRCSSMARQKRHELMTVEHLLLGLLANVEIAEVLKDCGADAEKLKTALEEFIDTSTPLNDGKQTQPTLGFQRVLQRAALQVESSGKNDVTHTSVLIAIYSEQESHALFLLQKHHIGLNDLVNADELKLLNPYENLELPADRERSGNQDFTMSDSTTISQILETNAALEQRVQALETLMDEFKIELKNLHRRRP